MDNIFSQPKLIYKISFSTFYKYVNSFEEFFPEDVLGISSFEIESKTIEAEKEDIWSLEIYFGYDPQGFLNKIKNFSKENKLKIIDNIKIETIEDKDWVLEYQKQLKPIKAGGFFISSASKAQECPPNLTSIVIEASRAFGTGEHSTTAGCLKLLTELSKESSSGNFTTIYDIGSGSGILSFASSLLWPKARVLACDIEEISVEVARFNQQFNDTHIHFYQNSVDSLEVPLFYDKFDLIISNILARPLIELASAIKALLNKNAKLILSGFLDYQTNEVIEAYESVGLRVIRVQYEEHWAVVMLEVIL